MHNDRERILSILAYNTVGFSLTLRKYLSHFSDILVVLEFSLLPRPPHVFQHGNGQQLTSGVLGVIMTIYMPPPP